MARTLAALILGAALLAGCQQKAVEHFSLPNLEGPVVAAPSDESAATLGTKVKPAQRALAREPGVPEAWVPDAPVNNWQWIVIHHSATPSGCAAAFDRGHRQKGWDELGYHFVIGNGTGSPDGSVEVGPRWGKQKWGAHAKTADNRYNDFGIGVCLVGNFDIDRPTAAQIRSLAQLTAYLMKTYHIPPDRVLGHGETKSTDCPGRNMSVAEVRRLACRLVADSERGEPALARKNADGSANPAAAR